MSKNSSILIYLYLIYFFFICGISSPFIYHFASPFINHHQELDNKWKVLPSVATGVCALFVGHFHALSAQLLKENASFAMEGVAELRKKHLLHVNKLKKTVLFLAIYVLLIQLFI